MGSHRIDWINCGLLLLASILAAFAPFGLFTLGYVLLGPLHYLTEIAWLHRHNYFLSKRSDSRWLAAFATIGVLCGGFGWLWFLVGDLDATVTRWLQYHGQQVAITAALLALAIPLVLWTFDTSAKRTFVAFSIGSLGVLYYYCGDAYLYYLLFAVLVPTVVHVYFFTGAFMLAGALRQRSMPGLISFILLTACGITLLLVDVPNVSLDSIFEPSYRDTIGYVHHNLFVTLDQGLDRQDDHILSLSGMRLSRFIAFAYVYHYLNWFSKTTVIGWHRIDRRKGFIVGAAWIICVVLYFMNYSVGLATVGLLSVLHVFLEFPLNWLSFRGIGKEGLAILMNGWNVGQVPRKPVSFLVARSFRK